MAAEDTQAKHPETPRGVIPYLTVTKGFEALAWYAKAFGAEELYSGKTDDGRLMHASMRINGGVVMSVCAAIEN